LTEGLSAALAAWVAVTAGDALATGGGAEVLLILGGLYAYPSLAAGLWAGAVGGAWRATFGPGSLGRVRRRLLADEELDRAATGALLAGLGAAVFFGAILALASLTLVGAVERKGVGALLLAALMIVALPACALLGLPLYRVARVVARVAPRPARVPACVLLAGAIMALIMVAGAWVVFTRLDWRILNLGPAAVLVGFVTVMSLWHVVLYTWLGATRRRVPRRGVILGVAAGAALLCPLVGLPGAPGRAAIDRVTEHSRGGPVLVRIARAQSDGDGDGYSAFLGGPDCDDDDPKIHPGATDTRGNGIDENCLGGDAPAERPAGDAGPGPDATTAVRRLDFAGNLLVIVVDTIRADRLGVAGYQRDGRSLTPRLDALAASAVRFSRAYAQAPNTPRSFPSIFTSRLPSQIAVDKGFKNYATVLDENVTLFEVLRDAGVHTVGVSSHFYFSDERGITQGFVEYDNRDAKEIAPSNKDIAAPRIVPRVEAKLAELAASGQRFAMFVHLFEPHSTYMTHDEYPITETGVIGLEQKYDYEIAYVDQWIGRILDAVAEQGLADRTIVAVLSDHGEAFGAHRVAGKKMYFHGQTLYDELLRVPLLLRIPGVAPAVHDDTVMLIDVGPTLLAAMGVAAPPSFRGRSLLGRVLGDELPPRPAYGELLPAPSWDHEWKMMLEGDGRWKLIYRLSDARFELYDLASDPGEQRDLYRERPDDARRLEQALAAWIESS
jgi:arylsulfatase A-like enzyme